jgi:hypothetical protein
VSTSQTFAGPLTSAEMNSLPQGTLGYAPVTANQGTFTAATDLTGLTVTVTLVAGRRIRISAHAGFQSSVAADTVEFNIQEGATILQYGLIGMTIANRIFTSDPSVVLTPTVGAHTYKLNAQRVDGTGNITLVAGATQPAFILVEDIGT